MIEIKNISKTYDNKIIIDGYSLSVNEGECVILSMASGAGKSTFFRLLSGIETADKGSITGVPKRIGMLFQEDRLCENFSALENVSMVIGKENACEAIINNLSAVGIEEHSKPVKELSGGQRRRVALVRALMSNSELVIMDEPLSGLDDETISQVTEYILKNTENKTLFIASHNQDFIEVMRERRGARVIEQF